MESGRWLCVWERRCVVVAFGVSFSKVVWGGGLGNAIKGKTGSTGVGI